MKKISILNKNHHKQSFSCGQAAFDGYLKKQALQNITRRIAVTFVLTQDDDLTVLGYYSLASTSIYAGKLPEALTKKPPRYPMLPAILLRRLAVDLNYERKGFS